MKKLTCLAAIGFGLFAGQAAVAQSEEEDLIYPPDESVPSENCVSLSFVRDTEVVDDRNILFYMRGDEIYRNVLPHRCPGLERREAFMYRTTLNRLCSVDVITVLSPIGPGFMPGASCGLGKFYPVSEAEAEALKEEAERVRELGLD